MFQLITCNVMSKDIKHSILRIIELSIRSNKFLNKNEITILTSLFTNLISKANIINKQEVVLLNRCILHLNNRSKVNDSLKILRTKKIKQVEIRARKQNRELFKVSRLLEYCSLFLLCILSISE